MEEEAKRKRWEAEFPAVPSLQHLGRGQEQSRGFRSECSGCFRRGGAAGKMGPAWDAGRPCAPGALSGAAYLRRGRQNALPGTARGVRGAEPGNPEPITQGRT